jgi:aspartyl-tRNA(Asn)/glutamyl-tRNA(Gln) amidotransferase subunit C
VSDTSPGPLSDTASDSLDPALTADDVRHIATLARIGMTDEEVEKFRAELSSIIGHCNALALIDTDGVEPTMNGADVTNVMADDVSRPSLTVEEALANAPHRHDDYLRVRAVLE